GSPPTAAISSAAVRTARAASPGSCGAAPVRPPRAPTSAPRATTTSRSDGPARPATAAQRPPRSRRADPQAQLLLLPREGAGGGLQEHQPAPTLRLGEGQDPLAADHRRLPAAPAAGGCRGQTGARDGAPGVRKDLAGCR